MALTKKQQLFADKYIETLNATQSAIFAGYSKKTAQVIGSENLQKPLVAEYIKKAMDKKNNDVIMSQDEVLEGISKIARNGNEETKDRLKALELMGKRYAVFTTKIEQTTTNSSVDRLIDSIESIKNGS